MYDIDTSECLLCSSMAKVYERDFGNEFVYNCTKCGKYLISKSALPRVRTFSESWRNDLSELAAHAASGCILRINRDGYGYEDL